jgi:hypothetical protein
MKAAMRPTRLNAKTRARRKQAPGYRKKATAAFQRAYEQLFGSQGAASPVRRIDPVTGEVIAIIKPDQFKRRGDSMDTHNTRGVVLGLVVIIFACAAILAGSYPPG